MYKWNEKNNELSFWDPNSLTGFYDQFNTYTLSDKSIINRPLGVKSEQVLEALMNITSELVEIVENESQPTQDEWGRPTESLPL